jgi:hypothetical protein
VREGKVTKSQELSGLMQMQEYSSKPLSNPNQKSNLFGERPA